MATIVASLDSVSRKLGQTQALDSLTLALHSGEILALLGPNGAGKTTAVRVLMGLLRPDTGSVRLFGKAPALAQRSRIGAMLQVSGVPDTLTVAEVLRSFRAYYSHPMPLDEVIALTELDDILTKRFGRLSGGQRQRALLALAVCGDPDLLFLDEPTVGLDVGARRQLWALVRRLAAQGRAVLLTTHYLEEADALATRVAVIHQGRLIADSSPQQLKSRVPTRKLRCRTQLPLASIQALASVSSASRQDGWTTVATCDAESVLRVMLAQDSELSGLEVNGASLESAFMALTQGRVAA